MRALHLLPLLGLAAALAAAGLAAQGRQSPLPQINAPGQIGPKPPVGSGGCSMTAPTCADVAPAIIRSALGPSPVEHNFRALASLIGSGATGSSAESTVRWAVRAFRKSGVDEAGSEAYNLPVRGSAGSRAGANVVAEIRGWQKPNEFVILGAPVDLRAHTAGALEGAYNAAVLIDAARAIHAAGTRPLRSIRFVLFAGPERNSMSAWAYVRAHREELDFADAMILYDAGDEPVSGYDLDGWRSLETPLRKALAPAAPLGSLQDSYAASLGAADFDFLLEGVPTLATNPRPASGAPAKFNFRVLQRNVALAALTAYAIADSPERLAQRQTRPAIERLLKRTGLENEMTKSGIWPEWVDGTRGRQH